MRRGNSPIGPDGNPINLHHMTQRNVSNIAEVEQSFHKKNHKTIHVNTKDIPSGIDRNEFSKWKKEYWKNRARDFE